MHQLVMPIQALLMDIHCKRKRAGRARFGFYLFIFDGPTMILLVLGLERIVE